MRWLIAAFVLLAVVGPASGNAASRCVDTAVDPSAHVVACTHAVETTRATQAYIDRARAYRDAARWDDAETDLDKALAHDPRSVEALSLRADMRSLNGNRKGAIADLDKAVAIRPGAALFRQRGDMWSFADDKRAVAEYTKALALEPNDVATLRCRAEAYARLNRAPLARDDYDRALEIDPGDVETLIARGRFFREQLRLTQSLTDFTAAIERDPNNLTAHRERAETYARQNNFDPAIADLSRVLARAPKDLSALRARRSAYLETRDSAHAIADAERVFAIASYVYTSDHLERALAYLRRGGEAAFARAEADLEAVAQLKRGDERGAIKLLRNLCDIFCGLRKARGLGILLLVAPSREALDRDRNIADAEAYMGILALKRGDDAKAAAIFAGAMKISRESAVAYYGRGVIKHNAGDVEGAKDDFARAREHHGDMHLLFARAGIEPVPARHAIMVEQIPDAAGAERDIAMCQKGDPAEPAPGVPLDFAAEIDACTRVVRANLAKETKARAYANRARWRGMKNDRDGAVDDYNAALTVNPDNVEALIYIGGYLTGQRKYEEAVAAFDRAVKADPKSFHALFGRCEVRVAQGDFKAALADCDRAVAVSGDDAMVKVRRAPMLLRAGENKRALHDYDLILRELARHGLPDDPYARFGRAVALKRLGDTAGAETDFKRARAQAPGVDLEFAELGIKP